MNILISLMKILSDFEHVSVDKILKILGVDDINDVKLIKDILESLTINREKIFGKIFENLTFLQNLVSRICEVLKENNIEIEECKYEEVRKGWERAWYSRLSKMISEAEVKGEIEIKIAPLIQSKTIVINIGKIFQHFLDIIKELSCKNINFIGNKNIIVIDLEHVVDNLIDKLVSNDLSTDLYIRDIIKNHIRSFIKYKMIPDIFECLGIARVDNYDNKDVIVFNKGFLSELCENTNKETQWTT